VNIILTLVLEVSEITTPTGSGRLLANVKIESSGSTAVIVYEYGKREYAIVCATDVITGESFTDKIVTTKLFKSKAPAVSVNFIVTVSDPKTFEIVVNTKVHWFAVLTTATLIKSVSRTLIVKFPNVSLTSESV